MRLGKYTIENAREMYIKGFNIKKIAKILEKKESTVTQYKYLDKKAGNDWDRLRSDYIKGTITNDKQILYDSFIDKMNNAIIEIENDQKLDSIEKSKLLAQIADSFSKIMKILYRSDPKKYFIDVIQGYTTLISNTALEAEEHQVVDWLNTLSQNETFFQGINKLKKEFNDKAMF